MQFSFAHNNFNVRDLDRSLSFYKEALGLTESSRINAPDGSFIIVYLTDGVTPHLSNTKLSWPHRLWRQGHKESLRFSALMFASS